MWIRLVGILLFLSILAGGARQPISIDDVLRSPKAEHLDPVWSPNGKSFVYEKHGSVYRFDILRRKAAVWFPLDSLEHASRSANDAQGASWQNRRVSESQFQWFPDGENLLASVKGSIFVVHANGKSEQVATEQGQPEDAKLSPDGKQILYRWGANLYVLDLGTKGTRQLTSEGSATLLNGQMDWVYPEELDLSTASWWSPDSKRICYLQFDISKEFVYPQVDLLRLRAISEPQRYPQAGTPNATVRVGVVSADGGATTWMALGDDPNTLVARVAWLPDSSAVAIETAPRLQNALDLQFADPHTGTKRLIIHEESKTWLNIADNLVFLKRSPEFFWTSERSGFRHLFRYSTNGEILAQVTSGSWEVSRIAGVDEEQKQLLYTSGETGPLSTQLYSVGFAGGERTRLTDPDRDHVIRANEDGSYYLDRSSSLTEPPQTVLRSRTDDLHVELLSPDKGSKHLDLQPVEIVKIPASNGDVLYGKLIKPNGYRAGTKYPAIVEVYGGPQAQSVRNSWTGANMAQVYAANGYVVWQLDNHGSFGRGHAFETPVYHELGRQEVADQVLGVKHLAAMGLIDPERVGVTGWSYGGFMTLHCLLFAPDTFRVGVAGAPVTDWHNYDTIYTERYMGLPEENAQGYRASSNVIHAGRLRGKLLIEHNIEDDNVLFQNSMQMVKALEEAHKQYVMQLYPEKTHGVSGPVEKTLLEATLDFFNRNLR